MQIYLAKGQSASDEILIWMFIIVLIVAIIGSRWAYYKLSPIVRKLWHRLPFVH